MRLVGLFLVVGFLLSGCINPAQYETEPVVLKTKRGPVVCQLYTKERVDWDRAIQWPRGIDQKAADKLCLAEGLRIMKG